MRKLSDVPAHFAEPSDMPHVAAPLLLGLAVCASLLVWVALAWAVL
ncbi:MULTISPECIES: hypothetical protein [unclassified Sphingosinithalassobacter]|nr:hypothetical protein [Sphingosinithalassobacter sp. CS137]